VASIQILLIDDNPQDRDLAERELRRHFPDCTVVGVGTQKELIRALKTRRFSVAITDYHLPGTDGLAVFRRIREQDPACPVILYTGSAGKATAARAIEAGVDDYVVKSVDRLPQLMLSVRRALDRRNQQQAVALAEDAMRLNADRLELVFNSVSDMLMLMSVEPGGDFRVIRVNQTVTAITGRPPETMIGKTMRDFLRGPVILFNEEKMLRAVRIGETVEYLLSTRPPGRPRLSMNVTLIPISDSDGARRHLLIVARDISARLQSELRIRHTLHALRESERRYRTLAEAMHDMVFIIRRDQTVEYVNSFAGEMFHRPVSDLVGRPMEALFPSAVAERQAGVLRHILETGEPAYRENPSWIGDRELWIGTWLVPMRDSSGRIGSVLGVARDITERITVEQALRESEEQYRSLVQTSPDAIFLHDLDTSFSYCNPRALEFLGYASPEELRGTYLLDLVHPDDRGVGEAHVKNLMQTGSLRNVVLTILRKDGSGVPMEISSSLVVDASGRRKAITSFLRDLSERRKRERALIESEARFRAMFERAAVGIALIGMDGRLIDANAALCGILEIPHEKLIRMEPNHLVHAEDYAVFEFEFGDILAGRREHYRKEIRLLANNGQPVWCRLMVSAVKNLQNEPMFIIAMAEDISKQREAEQASLQAADSLRRSAGRLETLHEIDRAILEARTPEEIAHATLERLHRLVPSHHSNLAMFEYPAATATILDTFDVTSPFVEKGLTYSIREYDSEIAKLKSGKPFAVEDLLTADNVSAAEKALRENGVRSYMNFPLTSHGELIGALHIASEAPGSFTREHAEIASEVADLLAVAIQQSRLFHQVRQHTFELEAIAALTEDLRAAAGSAEIPGVVIRHAERILRCDFAALLAADSSGEHFLVEKTTEYGMSAAGRRISRKDSLTGRIVAEGKPWRRSPPAEAGSEFADLLQGLQSAACAPMSSRGALIGALWIGRSSRSPAGEIREEDMRLLQSIAEVAGNTMHRTALFEQTERRLRRLSALRAVDMAISASIDLRVTLSVLLDQLTAMLEVDAAAIRLLNVHSQTLTYLVGRGFQSPALFQLPLQLGQGYAGAAVLEHRVVSVAPLSGQDNAYARLLSGGDEHFVSYFVAPLTAKGRIKGVLELFHRRVVRPDDEWIEYLETMATQAAIAIDNSSMFEDVQKTNTDLIAAYDATIEGWSRALEYRDRETQGHTLRVTDITVRLARIMGIREDELVHVRRGALMHDIGKMAISDTLLLKPEPLTPDEQEIMHRHPAYANEMLSAISYLRPALDIPYCHHERWDGTGYPRGLTGDQIPLAARVFAVIDVWDALRTDRPYRAAWPEAKVRQYLREKSGTHFDPDVVEAFFHIVDEECQS
jgi:PAS domain S-box-containing protein